MDPSTIVVTQFNPSTGSLSFEFVGSNAGLAATRAATQPASSLGLLAMAPVNAPPSGTDSGGLSTGAIIAIAVVASVVGVILLGGIVFVVVRRGKGKAQDSEFRSYQGFEAPIMPNDPNFELPPSLEQGGSLDDDVPPPPLPLPQSNSSAANGTARQNDDYDIELGPPPPIPRLPVTQAMLDDL